jgi:hypothetical protein
MDESFQKMQDAIYASIANTPCKDPMDAVMALCCVMCELLVQIKMDDNRMVCNAVLNTLEMSRREHQEREFH